MTDGHIEVEGQLRKYSYILIVLQSDQLKKNGSITKYMPNPVNKPLLSVA